LLAKDGWWKVPESLVRALLIVGDDPVVDDVAHLAQGAEEVGVEDFVSKGAIESLDASVLGGGLPGWVW